MKASVATTGGLSPLRSAERHSRRGGGGMTSVRDTPLRCAPYRVLRRAEHCTPLARHGLAFSQPSIDLATPPNLGGQS
jgi:hypothetical protein